MHRKNNPINFDLNMLRVFAYVVEQHSFTKAADKLDMAKSTVSRKIADLENFLGVKLLARSTRNLTFTPEGKEFYLLCRESLDSIRYGTIDLMNNNDSIKGPIKMLMPIEIGLGYGGKVVHDFMNAYPNINVDLELSNRKVDVISEGFDLIIQVGDIHDSTLIKRTFIHGRQILVASPGYLKKFGTPQSIEDLDSSHMQIKFNSSGFPNNPIAHLPCRIKVNSKKSMVQASIENFGLAIVPLHLCYKHFLQGELVHLLCGDISFKVPASFVYPERKLIPKRVKLFMDFAIAQGTEIETEIFNNINGLA